MAKRYPLFWIGWVVVVGINAENGYANRCASDVAVRMQATAHQIAVQNRALDVMFLWAREVHAVSGCFQRLKEDTHGILSCSTSD